MPEPEGLVAGERRAVGPDQLPPEEGGDVPVHSPIKLAAAQLHDRPAMEDPALDRRTLGDRSLLGIELIEPRREERLDAGRNGHRRQIGRRHPSAVPKRERPVVDQHRDELLDEQRVPVRRLGDPVFGVRFESRAPEQLLDQPRRFRFGERLEMDGGRVELAAAPRRPTIEQLGPGQAQQEHRCVARPVGDVLDQIQERGLGPVDIVEDDDQRRAASDVLEEPPDRPQRLVGRAGHVGEPDRLGDTIEDPSSLLVTFEQRSELRGHVRRSIVVRDDRRPT